MLISSDSRTRYWAVLATTLFSSAAVAQDACYDIGHPIERLECFDKWASEKAGRPIGTVKVSEILAAKNGEKIVIKAPELAPLNDAASELAAADQPSTSTALTENPADETPPSRWIVNTEKSAMADTKNVFAKITSDSRVSCRQYGEPSYLTLWLRCMENTTAVIIGGDCHVASGFYGYGEVTYRLDEDKAKTKNFEASTDSSSLGLWNGGSAIPFIKGMMGKDKLLVRFTPFGMNPVEASFDITGTEDAVKDLRGSCGW